MMEKYLQSNMHGSADPDQKVMDPQHCLEHRMKAKGSKKKDVFNLDYLRAHKVIMYSDSTTLCWLYLQNGEYEIYLEQKPDICRVYLWDKVKKLDKYLRNSYVLPDLDQVIPYLRVLTLFNFYQLSVRLEWSLWKLTVCYRPDFHVNCKYYQTKSSPQIRQTVESKALPNKFLP
jgi:hypothetical protein